MIDMAIITISRQYGSGAEELVEMLSETSGFQIVSKSEIEEKLQGFIGGFFAQKFTTEREPTFIDKYIYDMELWKGLLYEALLLSAKKGNVILLGRGGSEILKDTPGTLRLLIVGEKSKRIDYVSEKENLTPMDAEEKIDEVDSEIERFCKYHFGIDWPDPSKYDITFNFHNIGIERCAEIISTTTEKLDLPTAFKRDGRNILQRRYTEVSATNRIIHSAGIDKNLFQVIVKDDKRIRIKFEDVPPEQRAAAKKTVSIFHKGYSVIS